MKKLVAFLIALTLLFTVVSVATAQTLVRLPGIGIENTALGDDSAAFTRSYFFDIPDGVIAETIMLNVWANSVLDSVDLDFSAWQAMKVGAYEDSASYKLAADSVIVKATHQVETYTRYPIYGVADDTLVTASTSISGLQALNMAAFNTALMVNVQGGGATNSSDTEFVIFLTAVKLD